MDLVFKILLATFYGGILGAERSRAKKSAGFRTYMLVTLASTAFTIIAQEAESILNQSTFDAGRIIAQIILGIGFIGAGIIFYQKEHIHGLTTAAGLWTSTSIGIAIGLGLYELATLVTLVSFIILALLPYIQDIIE
jgi:putative Mg2+ transporter-C (MgtC) family protein